MPHIGKLRHKVTLQKPTYQQDGSRVSWQTVDHIWAHIRSQRGQEKDLQQGQQTTHFYIVTIRARNDITPDMRFLHNGNPLHILTHSDPDGYQKWTQCRCQHIWNEENL